MRRKASVLRMRPARDRTTTPARRPVPGPSAPRPDGVDQGRWSLTGRDTITRRGGLLSVMVRVTAVG
jgi:hypothetical protein